MARTSLSRLFPWISDLPVTKLSLTTARSESTPRSVSNSVTRFLSSQSQSNHDEEKATKEKDEVKENLEVRNEGEGEDEGGYHVNEETGEVGGPKGPEPTRYGDWERNGRCYDF